MGMNDYHAVMTANRHHIQQLEERATLLASLGFRPSGGFERLFRRRVVALATDFTITHSAVGPAASRQQAA